MVIYPVDPQQPHSPRECRSHLQCCLKKSLKRDFKTHSFFSDVLQKDTGSGEARRMGEEEDEGGLGLRSSTVVSWSAIES